MKLYYTDIKGIYYIDKGDGIEDSEEYGEDFKYEPDENKKNEKLAELLIKRNFEGLNVDESQQKIIKDGLVWLLEEMCDEELTKWEEFFREELTEAFEEEAFKE